MAIAVPDLGDRFVVRGPLGSGGEAQVLRAWDCTLRREVTLKLRRLDASTHGAIEHEAETLRALHAHPNLPVALDDLRVGDWHVLVMAYVDGGDLRDLLSLKGSPGLEPGLVLHHLVEAAKALDHLHAHVPPVCHGDVKPANVVIGAGRRPRTVLVDLGLAGHTGDVRVEGTGAYSAPETPTTGRSPEGDIFSLAATAHALLTGYPPEPGVEADWSGLAPGTADAVRGVLSRGLSVSPPDRQASAGELVTDLGRALGPPVRVARRPYRAVAAAATLLALVLLGASARPVPHDDTAEGQVVPTVAPPTGSAASTSPPAASVALPVLPAVVTPGVAPASVSPAGVPRAPVVPPAVASRSGQRIGVLYQRAWILDTVYGLIDVSHVDALGKLVTERSNTDLRDEIDEAVYVGDDLVGQYAPATGDLRPVRVLADGATAFGPSVIVRQGFTTRVGLGSGWLLLYDPTTGYTTTVRFDDDGNYLPAMRHDAPLPPGYDAAVRVADHSALLYRKSDGSTLLVDVRKEPDGPGRAGPPLSPGLVALCDDLQGTLVGFDAAGRATSMRWYDGAVRTLATFDTGRPWPRCAPAKRAVLVFDGQLGAVVHLDDKGRSSRQVTLQLPSGSSLVYLGPRP